MLLNWLVLMHLCCFSLVSLVFKVIFVQFQVLWSKYAKGAFWSFLEQNWAWNGLHMFGARKMDEIEDQKRLEVKRNQF